MEVCSKMLTAANLVSLKKVERGICLICALYPIRKCSFSVASSAPYKRDSQASYHM